MRDDQDRLMCDVPFCPARSSRPGHHWICSGHWDCVPRQVRASWHQVTREALFTMWPDLVWAAIMGGHIMRRRQDTYAHDTQD